MTMIELNSRLLQLYLKLSSQAYRADGDEVVQEVAEICAGLLEPANPSLDAIFDRYVKLISLHLDQSGQERLRLVAFERAGAPDQPALPPRPARFAEQGDDLRPLTAGGEPGISLVTCSMNRTENLIKALPSWIANPEISEILIVDWCSRSPVAHDLQQAEITDPRIRIVRVDDEPRWILSYAFNVGFRAAACDTILKVDADIVLSPDFFKKNHVTEGSFIAGNWRTAAEDQAHVNGFFFISRKALAEVGGFNEHITTYGWDDDDIYDRLTLMGQRRRNVAAGTIFHLEHDDEDRIGDSGTRGAVQTLSDILTSGTRFLIRRNRYIAMVMPHWDSTSIPLPFRVKAVTDNLMSVRREGWEPSAVPAHVQTAAREHALSELTAWRLGRRVLELDPTRLAPVLARSNQQVSRIDVELAIAAPHHVIGGSGSYLVVELAEEILGGSTLTTDQNLGLRAIVAAAHSNRLVPLVRGPFLTLPDMAPGGLRALPVIPSWHPIEDLARLPIAALLSGKVDRDINHSIRIGLTDLRKAAFAAPTVQISRPRLFVDAQHGLGNRMRAIGSAAAIAAASDRELVIVWQPDDHCDGQFQDLFTYDGAVLDTRFVETAASQGCDVYNYMPNEAGSDKGATIRLDTTRDIYARGAFVFSSPHSTWESENRFLQTLVPVEPIRDLIASVRQPNALAAHVRMEAGAGLDHNTYDRPENWRPEDHALIHEWRAKSHFSRFLNRIDTLIAEDRADGIFLAADLPSTYAEFQHHYGDRLAWLPRNLYDRSAEQLHYAMADAILLSRSPLLLGSTWSSFSELAMRLARQEIKIEMSGTDF